jgi:hypothetical protein
MTSIWYVLSLLKIPVSWVFPFFSDLRDWRRSRWVLHWTIHALIIAGIAGLLYYLQNHTNLKDDFHSVLKVSALGLQRFLLPLLFLALYAAGWLIRWIWYLIFGETAGSPFPDIDAAWTEINLVMRQLGLSWTDAPVFLVLGRPAEGEEALLRGSSIPFQARAIPRRPEAPTRIYANRDAIFLTCTGASLLGKHAALLAGEGGPGDLLAAPPLADPKHADGTIGLPDGDPGVQVLKEIMNRAMQAGRNGAYTEEEKNLMRRAQRVRYRSLVESRDLMQWYTARLVYLCQLLANERSPFIPLNGIIMVVPFHATESAPDTNDTGLICQRELAVVRQTLKCQCPVLALVADIEDLPGFDELIQRFEPEALTRRVGQRFPLVPDLPHEQIAPKAAAAVHWVCAVLVPSWIVRLFNPPNVGGAMEVNTRLFRLMFLVQQRQLRLGEIIRRALAQDGEPLWFAGCYLAGTGRGPPRQAFLPGVFQRIVQEQDKVSWTHDALADDRWRNTMASVGYGVVAVLWLVSLAIVGWHVFVTVK